MLYHVCSSGSQICDEGTAGADAWTCFCGTLVTSSGGPSGGRGFAGWMRFAFAFFHFGSVALSTPATVDAAKDARECHTGCALGSFQAGGGGWGCRRD